jgi:hypothetical protein
MAWCHAPRAPITPSSYSRLGSVFAGLGLDRSTVQKTDASHDVTHDAARGDMALSRLRFRCSNCGSDRTDFVVTSRDNP